ncbi:MAG: hypothetical protein WAO19_07980 [Candidatus Kryptoniota bacterium]
MSNRLIILFAFILCLSNAENAAAEEPLQSLLNDSTSHDVPDTTSFKTYIPLGFDVFLSLDAFGLHFNANGDGGASVGLGGEVHVRPVFVGAILTGLSTNEGIVSADGTPDYRFNSLYGGTYIGDFRLDIGEIHGWGQGIG